MPKCICGCDNEFVFAHCRACTLAGRKSSHMEVICFDGNIEIYCAECGRPVLNTHSGDFHFENLSEATGSQFETKKPEVHH